MKALLLPSLCAVLLAGCNPDNPAATAASAAAATTLGAAPGQPAAAVATNTPTTPAASASGTVAAGSPPVTASAPIAAAVATSTNAPTPVIAVRPPAPPPELPAPVDEVVKLAQTSVDPSVVVQYVESIREPFTLNADQIIYLSDLGMGTPVINALLKQAAQSPATSPAPVQNVVIQAAAAPAAAPAAEPTGTDPAGQNVILTNYLASTNAVGYAGIPGGQSQPAPAPVYGPAQPGPAPAAAAAQQVVVQQPVTYNVFYDSLSPYGNWVHIDPYGWCWQPTIVSVNPGWRPYADGGQWLWTDYGWYWHSTYSWGWAPFHYGRWHLASNRGWIWCPGVDWGPAWVSWRYTDSYCGWAPLPPECRWSAGVGFSWVSRGASVSVGFGIWDDCWYATPWNRFCDPGLPRWGLGRRDVHGFVRNSRQAIGGDNSVNIVGNNNTVIINNGVSRDEVQRRSRQEVRKYAVNDAATPDRAAQRLNSGASAARPEVAAYRPRIREESGARSAPPESVLARQESRKNPRPASAAASGSGMLPSRPGTGSGGSGQLGIAGGTGSGLAPSRPAPASGGGSSAAPAVAGTPYGRSGGTPQVPSTSRGGTVPSRPGVGTQGPMTAPSRNPVATPAPRPSPGVANPSVAPAPSQAPIIRSPGNNVPARPSVAPGSSGLTQTPQSSGQTAPLTARRQEGRLSAPLYSQPAYSSPAARPSVQPNVQQSIPAQRPDATGFRTAPGVRYESRKPEVGSRVGGGSYPGAMPSAPSASPAPMGPRNFNPSAGQGGNFRSPNMGSPAPSPRMSAPAPAPRMESRPMPAAPAAPAPRMSAPASRPVPSQGSSGGGPRTGPARAGSGFVGD